MLPLDLAAQVFHPPSAIGSIERRRIQRRFHTWMIVVDHRRRGRFPERRTAAQCVSIADLQGVYPFQKWRTPRCAAPATVIVIVPSKYLDDDARAHTTNKTYPQSHPWP